jgi:DNA-nicking Smr family endonuclease
MIEPEYELDLHGLRTAECKEVLEDLCTEPGYTHVRLIVGKGLNSVHGPVLPTFVKSFLREKHITYTEGEAYIDVYFTIPD